MPVASHAADLTVGELTQISSKRVTRAQFDYTYTVDVTNNGGLLTGVAATVSSTSPNTIIVEADLSFPDLAPGETATSIDTFTLRQNRRSLFDPTVLVYTFATSPGVPSDTTAPVIGVINPADGTILTTDSVEISGIVTDDTALDSVTVQGVTAVMNGEFFSAIIPLVSGANSIPIVATDAAGNSATRSLTLILDNVSPMVTLSAPSQVQAGGIMTVIAQVTDNVGVDNVSFYVDGLKIKDVTQAPYQLDYNAPEQAGGVVGVRVTARDTAGNEGSDSIQVAVVVMDDETPPVIEFIGLPPTAAAGETVSVSAQVSDDRGIASVQFFYANNELSDDIIPPYEAVFSLPVDAVVDTELVIDVMVTDTAGNMAQGQAALRVVAAVDISPPDPVSVQVPSEARSGQQVLVAGSAVDDIGISKVQFFADGFLFAEDTTPPFSTPFIVSDQQAVDRQIVFLMRASDFSGNQTDSAPAVMTIVAPADGFLSGEVYDASRGLPMHGARVELIMAGGQALTPPRQVMSDAQGRYRLSLAEGQADVRISQSGFTSVYRSLTVLPSTVNGVFDARLTPVFDGGLVGTTTGATFELADGSIALDITPATYANETMLELALLSGQALPGLLPNGWAPVSALFVGPDNVVTNNPFALSFLQAQDPDLIVARWDTTLRRWVRVATETGADTLTVVAVPGTYALLLADTVPTSPPIPNVGEALVGTPAQMIPANITASILPSPDILFMQPGARSDIDVFLNNTTALPSGTAFEVEFSESYARIDGKQLSPEPMTQDFVFYQRSGGFSAELVASPSQIFDAALLSEGLIHLDAHAPDGDGDSQVIGSGGGTVSTTDGASLIIPPAALGANTPISLRTLDNDSGGPTPGPLYSTLAGVLIDLGGKILESAAPLTLTLPSAPPADAQILAVQPIFLEGVSYFELIGVAAINGKRISIEAGALGLPLPGIRSGGRIYLVEMNAPVGYLTGNLINGVTPPQDALVEVDSLPFVSRTDRNNPQYVLAAPLGAATVNAQDLAFGSAASGTATLDAIAEIKVIDLSLGLLRPEVAEVTPSDGANGVASTASVSVRFSKEIDAATLDTNSLRVSSGGVVVAGSVFLSADQLTAVFQPNTPLTNETLYEVTITASVLDRFGNSLLGNQPDGSFVASFTTIDTTPPSVPEAGQITISVPENGVVEVAATQGAVEPGLTVTVIDESSGQSTSVIASEDGSFQVTLAATVDSRFTLIFIDAQDNQTQLNGLQMKTVGAAVLGPMGGTVQVSTGQSVDFPAGVFDNNAIIRVTPVPSPAPASIPVGLRMVGGSVTIDTGGAQMRLMTQVRVFSPEVPEFDFTEASWPFAIEQELKIPARLGDGDIITIIAQATRDNGSIVESQILIPVSTSTTDSTIRTVRDESANPAFEFLTPIRVAPRETVTIRVNAFDPDIVLTTPVPADFQQTGQIWLVAGISENGADYLNVLDTARLVINPDGSMEIRNNFGLSLLGGMVAVGISAGIGMLMGEDFIGYDLMFGVLGVVGGAAAGLVGAGTFFAGGAVIGPTLGIAAFAFKIAEMTGKIMLQKRPVFLLMRRGLPFDLDLINTDTNQLVESLSFEAPDPNNPPFNTLNLTGDETGPWINRLNQCADQQLALNGEISLRMSEFLEPFTVNSTTIELVPSGGFFSSGSPVSANLRYIGSEQSIRLQPTEALQPDTDYILRVTTTDIRDLAGNAGLENYSFTYRSQTTPMVNVTQETPGIPRDLEIIGNRAYVMDDTGIGVYDVDTLQSLGYLVARAAANNGAITPMQDINMVGADGTVLSGNYLFQVRGALDVFSSLAIIDVNNDQPVIVDKMFFTYPRAMLEDMIQTGFLGYPIPESAFGVPKLQGIPRDIETSGTTAAYAASVGIGIQSFHIPKVVGNHVAVPRGEVFGPSYPIDPQIYEQYQNGPPPIDFVSTNAASIFDLELFEGVLLAAGRAGLTFHDPETLERFDKLVLPNAPLGGLRVTGLSNYLYDVDGDGNTGTFEDNDFDSTTALDEIFDLALVSAGRAGLYIVDVTKEHVGTPKIIGHIVAAGMSAFEVVPLQGGHLLMLVDKSNGLRMIDLRKPTGIGLQDDNGDGVDDRLMSLINGTSGGITELKVLDGEKRALYIDPQGLHAVDLFSGPEYCTNSAPVTEAGTNQVVLEDNLVTLNGVSIDPDGSAITYAWSQIGGYGVTNSGTAPTLQGADTATPTFIAPSVISDRTLLFQLRVSDGTLFSVDTVTVTVVPVP